MKRTVNILKNYETNKKLCIHINETWSIDLADFADYKTLNSRRFRYILIIIEKFSEYTWGNPPKNKIAQTITKELSSIPTTSKRRPVNVESDRGRQYLLFYFSKVFES